MQAVTIAHAVGESADDQFGSCVRLADETHARTDFGRGLDAEHNLVSRISGSRNIPERLVFAVHGDRHHTQYFTNFAGRTLGRSNGQAHQ